MRIAALFLRLLSLLPDTVLYGISDVGAFSFRVFRYRKSVIIMNLKNSFPDKSQIEYNKIQIAFYKHLSDLFIESIISLRLSKNDLLKRYHCVNPELLTKYYEEGKSVVLISGHYNNWEYMVLSLALQFPFHGIGVGKRLSNIKMDKWINGYRQRYGTEVVFAENVRDTFLNYENQKKQSAYMMLIDQSPNDKKKAYWMTFLNQDSGIIYGAEYFAVKYNYPVFFYIVRKKKRGYYEFELFNINSSPKHEVKGEITEHSMHLLENEIVKKPEYWLWSHRRWKHKHPNEE